MAVGRRVFDSYVLALCAGSGFDIKSVAGYTPAEDAVNEQDISHWDQLGHERFWDRQRGGSEEGRGGRCGRRRGQCGLVRRAGKWAY